ncbi:SDR family NAD(P)-dependent oxidoreductase [Klenkia taihuensis]|uniref:3-oxoacyl-[acyl-carrier protein] reductase n=1 Tax=Klenkia taihuensis TaxID=1225127 RepID=A0A1I1Q0A0_9ACTN|nr:SDR family oxidoreductase [Klenkia taihuensis]GHE08263.1 3-oxoacyl-ACP reductase [Klenkia taihuensis]SFD15425.1 3-oxoacyl-[acyl-carrier protein] reductase [Klenkia taihuensis]
MSAVLQDRVVVVTGGAQGLGRAYAQRVVADGGTVVVADLDERKGAAVVDELVSAGGAASFAALDVGDPGAVAVFADTVASRFGAVHGLVNNAAIFSTITMRPFWEIPAAEWDRLMAVNLRGPWLVTSALLPGLREGARVGQGASVVNVGSDAVWLGRPGYLHYIASKGGVTGMTHAMAHELGGDRIRVNSISPGPTYTEVPRSTVSPEQRTAMQAAQALHRDAEPDDMVGVVAFLLSDDSRWITGQTLSVNGGVLHR